MHDDRSQKGKTRKNDEERGEFFEDVLDPRYHRMRPCKRGPQKQLQKAVLGLGFPQAGIGE